ncbi:hypothetical protein CR103_09740 [Massilia psychrophila]|uniref:Uncharacterized protein n=1 Tax=Massilia psychrophila TaxID=1603353 RepID=A0A2G8T1V7_9BURK|nr:hypothetical protein CR103_09740 [Massilia psychrophila]
MESTALLDVRQLRPRQTRHWRAGAVEPEAALIGTVLRRERCIDEYSGSNQPIVGMGRAERGMDGRAESAVAYRFV